MSDALHILEKSGEVQLKGCALHFRYYKPTKQENTEKTPLVILHGGPGACHELWYDVLKELCDDRPTLFYDQRGSFYSPCPFHPEYMAVEQFVEDLDAIVTEVGIDRFTLLGHSFGGAVAVAYMSRYATKVTSLILSSPLISVPWWQADTISRVKTLGFDAGHVLVCEQKGEFDDPEYVAAVKAFEKSHGILTEHGKAFVHYFKKTNHEVYKRMWGVSEFSSTGTLKDLDVSSILPDINVPTLFVFGEFDSVTNKTMEKAAFMMNARTSCILIKGSGHLSFLDNSQQYIKAVRSHLG